MSCSHRFSPICSNGKKILNQCKGKSREVNWEHKAILQAIRDRNPDLAEQLAKEHIVHVMQNLKKIEEKHNQEVAKDGKN